MSTRDGVIWKWTTARDGLNWTSVTKRPLANTASAWCCSRDSHPAKHGSEHVFFLDGDPFDHFAPLPPSPRRFSALFAPHDQLWLQKGVPQAGALIYAASPKHITLWEEAQAHESNKKPWSGFEVVLGGSRGLSRRANSLSAVLPPAIGAVTTGGFSFLCGNGVGRGVCEAIAVRDALAVSPARRGVAAVWGRDGKRDMEIDQQNAGCNGEAWGLALVGSSAQGCSKAHWLRPCVFVITE